MSESNYETSVKHDESLQLLSTRFISLLQDVKDGLLDLKMGSDILSVVLEGNSCKTGEKTKILKLKEELQDSKNKEIEIACNYALEEQEDDEAMEEGDSDDNNKTKEISAQPTRQLPPRKAAQRQLFIQSWYHENVKTKKISALKTEASPKERPTVRGRGGEKEKVSSESTSAASVSKVKDVSEEKENEKEVTEKTITRSRSRIVTLNQQNNEARRQDTENHPVNNRLNIRVSIQDKVFFEYLDIIEDVLQSLDKLCSLPSRRDYFFQLEKSKGAVDLFEITDPNIDPEEFDGPNVTDNFAKPRIICRPQFEAFLRREMCGSGKEAAKEAKRKYRCPYCFMLALSRDVILRHIQSLKKNGEWRRPSCLARRHKEPNPSGIYESKWPYPKRAPIIEIDCNDILIWIYSQLNIRIPRNCLREKKGSKFVRLNI